MRQLPFITFFIYFFFALLVFFIELIIRFEFCWILFKKVFFSILIHLFACVYIRHLIQKHICEYINKKKIIYILKITVSFLAFYPRNRPYLLKRVLLSNIFLVINVGYNSACSLELKIFLGACFNTSPEKKS